MKILFMGYHEAICLCLEEAVRQKHKIIGVVTNKLKEIQWYRDIGEVARRRHIPVYKPKKITKAFICKIRRMKPDLIVVIDYHKILSKEFIKIPKFGVINFHASLLPNYKGTAPLVRAICNNEKKAGTTLHYIDEGIDTGSIIAQKNFKIEQIDTIKEIILKHNKACLYLFKKHLPLIEKGEAPRKKQKHGNMYLWMYEKDGRIKLKSSALRIYNKIRALSYPFPNAFFVIKGKKVFIDIKNKNKVT